ncbi:MAG: LOW QUALITY PROTEIN: hypothetical protein KVP17_002829 [Porospora cf. gigantea B]|uniref:uncharacterized protein n=1 Tax=Porospora cf. gigantea B TaxID=2853592 RepID=UPI003571A015|nr:MAG: LOW QUALITY PROTEIN: hypothetical protein KVP17_002829 [Porospora cf. gigantea B]
MFDLMDVEIKPAKRTFWVPDPYVWHLGLDIGDPKLNAQHDVLMRLIHQLGEQPSNLKLLHSLIENLANHFPTEEEMMRDHSYTKVECATHLHRMFIADLRKLHTTLMAEEQGHRNKHNFKSIRIQHDSPASLSPAQILFMKNWFVQHILMLSCFQEEINGKQSTEEAVKTGIHWIDTVLEEKVEGPQTARLARRVDARRAPPKLRFKAAVLDASLKNGPIIMACLDFCQLTGRYPDELFDVPLMDFIRPRRLQSLASQEILRGASNRFEAADTFSGLMDEAKFRRYLRECGFEGSQTQTEASIGALKPAGYSCGAEHYDVFDLSRPNGEVIPVIVVALLIQVAPLDPAKPYSSSESSFESMERASSTAPMVGIMMTECGKELDMADMDHEAANLLCAVGPKVVLTQASEKAVEQGDFGRQIRSKVCRLKRPELQRRTTNVLYTVLSKPSAESMTEVSASDEEASWKVSHVFKNNKIERVHQPQGDLDITPQCESEALWRPETLRLAKPTFVAKPKHPL